MSEKLLQLRQALAVLLRRRPDGEVTKDLLGASRDGEGTHVAVDALDALADATAHVAGATRRKQRGAVVIITSLLCAELPNPKKCIFYRERNFDHELPHMFNRQPTSPRMA